MIKVELEIIYRDYIACLNNRDWAMLARFVHKDVHHNGDALGIDGYRSMLEANYRQIPDLRFEIEILVADPPRVASRLSFDVSPAADFLGVPVNGRRVKFCENVFYEFRGGLIEKVWSVIDKAAIEEQLR